MCGIAGLIHHQGLPGSWARDLEAMASRLIHRGPDDFGYFWAGKGRKAAEDFPIQDLPRESVAAHAAFAHRRLSILDLSPNARQPMVRAGGDVFLTYNGEIYNYAELRKELESHGARFRTSSDTEVLLEAYLRWRIGCVEKLRGIFAFGLMDLKNGKAFLVRDHLGVKPLYYTQVGGALAFASEQKAFLGIEAFKPELDPAALRKYLSFLWIPGEHTGLAGVRKLEPGSWMEFDLTTGAVKTTQYWSPLLAAEKPGETLSIEGLRAELERAVSEEMVSDVPLGAFLSGGLDSSLITALMQKSSRHATRTFSIGYSQKDLSYDIVPDDMPYARMASQELGTVNHEYVLSPALAELLPKVVWHLDEPLGDPAAISSFLICEAARQELTVMLSGMGGDELFAGYPRQRALMLGEVYRKFPKPARSLAHWLGSQLPAAGTNLQSKIGRSAKKFLLAAEADPITHYHSMETYFTDANQEALLNPDGALAKATNPVEAEYARLRRAIDDACVELGDESPLRKALLLDLMTYLPNLNLAYTDRTSMANSIEVRVPLLDIRLVEASLRLPPQDLLRLTQGRLQGKWILKKAAEPYLSPKIIWRKKAGFGAPVRSWLRKDLAEMKAELLGPRGLGARGWFQASEIERIDRAFMEGSEDNALKLWMLMSLELWARSFIGEAGSAGTEKK